MLVKHGSWQMRCKKIEVVESKYGGKTCGNGGNERYDKTGLE